MGTLSTDWVRPGESPGVNRDWSYPSSDFGSLASQRQCPSVSAVSTRSAEPRSWALVVHPLLGGRSGQGPGSVATKSRYTDMAVQCDPDDDDSALVRPDGECSCDQWIQSMFRGRVKVYRTGRVTTSVKKSDGSSGHDCFVVVRIDRKLPLKVSCSLLAKLQVWGAHRPRDKSSLLAMRSRASEYAKEIGLPLDYLAEVLPATLVLALMVTEPERRSMEYLQGAEGELVVDWSRKLKEGELRKDPPELMTGSILAASFLGLGLTHAWKHGLVGLAMGTGPHSALIPTALVLTGGIVAWKLPRAKVELAKA